MHRLTFLGLGLVAVLASAGWRMTHCCSRETIFEPKTNPPEAAPLCPWRQPEADMNRLFPGATRYEHRTRILSGQRVELAERLGRQPAGEENALHLYRVYRESTFLGTILLRRVKGEHGAIELVVAADPEHQISGILLQRLREPEPAADALQNPEWLRRFTGRSAESMAQFGKEIGAIPNEARSSAGAIVEGVRSGLILLAAADGADRAGQVATLHH